MSRYSYVCECGFRFDQTRPMADRNNPTTCPRCGRDAKRDQFSDYRSQRLALLPEFHEHFNVSLGQTISSRAHLKHIQLTKGYEDADVKAQPPTDWY